MGYSQATRGIVHLAVPKGMSTIASASQRSACRSLGIENAGMNVRRQDDLVVWCVVVTIVVPPDHDPCQMESALMPPYLWQDHAICPANRFS